jgi:predicted N-formylglutamate amidohydrolase
VHQDTPTPTPPPPLFETIDGSACVLLISIHEGEFIPSSLNDEQGAPLGLKDLADLPRHIIVDCGIREVTRLLRELTRASSFRATHSRLVADVNRFSDEADSIAPVADGVIIPLNRSLRAHEREERLMHFYYPVIQGIEAFVGKIAAKNGYEPFVVCMHSFARSLSQDPQHPKRQDICVFSYPEFGPLPNVEAFVRTLRDQNPGLAVGCNEPFSARTPGLQTEPGDKRLASPPSYYGVVERGNVANHFAIEICQDLICDRSGQARLASVIAEALHTTFDLEGRQPRLRVIPR